MTASAVATFTRLSSASDISASEPVSCQATALSASTARPTITLPIAIRMIRLAGAVTMPCLLAGFQRHAVKLQPVTDQAIAQLLGDLLLQRLDLGIDEFDDLAGIHVDEVVVE